MKGILNTIQKGWMVMATFWEQLLALLAVLFIVAGTIYGYRSWRRNKMD